jgi:hypothetical protein
MEDGTPALHTTLRLKDEKTFKMVLTAISSLCYFLFGFASSLSKLTNHFKSIATRG